MERRYSLLKLLVYISECRTTKLYSELLKLAVLQGTREYSLNPLQEMVTCVVITTERNLLTYIKLNLFKA